MQRVPFLLCFFLLTLIQPLAAPPPPQESLPVANLFIHPLIAYPEKAFVEGKDESRVDEWFITTDEFKKALESLEARGYILVKASDAYVVSSDGVTSGALDLPKGRKPLLLSVDDLNYYTYMRANGTVSRLAVDETGRLVAQTALPGGGFRSDVDKEIPQILEDFLLAHPDFSYHGARGLIGVTGYAGVFGWPTQWAGPRLSEARKAVVKVATALKNLGWEFASHSYSHRTKRSQTDEDWVRSEARWQGEVAPLLGATPFYILPYGEAWWKDPFRWELLTKAGFKVFFGVETTSNLVWKDGLPIVGRVPLDGRGLRRRFGQLSPFLDPKTVWDPRRPATMKY